jgi:hypothetical protein
MRVPGGRVQTCPGPDRSAVVHILDPAGVMPAAGAGGGVEFLAQQPGGSLLFVVHPITMACAWLRR